MTVLVQNRSLREAFKRGERTAMIEVYREYAKGVFGLLSNGFVIKSKVSHYYFKGYKDPFKLEGAVQEVFVRAFSESARAAYDGIRPYKNFLFTIARNLVIDSYRQNAREFVLFDDLPTNNKERLLAEQWHSSHSPEESLVWTQLKKQVEQFLQSLTEEEQALFHVRFLNGLSVEATSKHLELTEYQVKRDEKRIKKRFFQWMKNNGYFDSYRFRDIGITQLVVFAFVFIWFGNHVERYT